MKFQQRNIIITISLIIICVTVSTFLIYPSVFGIISISKEIEVERAGLEERYQEGMSIKRVYADYENIKNELSLMNSAILKVGEELKFITSLENIARDNNLTQKLDMDADSVKQFEGYQIMRISLSLNGSYEDLMNYLIQIEKMEYYINIDSIEMSGGQPNTSNNQLNNIPRSPDSTNITQKNSYNTDLRLDIKAMSYWKIIENTPLFQ